MRRRGGCVARRESLIAALQQHSTPRDLGLASTVSKHSHCLDPLIDFAHQLFWKTD
jgi:hypothetical protein